MLRSDRCFLCVLIERVFRMKNVPFLLEVIYCICLYVTMYAGIEVMVSLFES